MDNEGVLYTWYAARTFRRCFVHLVCSADFQRFIGTELCKPAFAIVGTQISLHKYPRNGMDFCSVYFGASVETGPRYHRIFRHGHRHFSSCINWDHRRTSQFSGEVGLNLGAGGRPGMEQGALIRHPFSAATSSDTIVPGCSGDFPCHLQRKPILHSWKECAMKTTCHI
jgi:hypothetical protein